MRILVDTDKVKIINKPTLCKGEYGVHKCEFEFSDEYTDLVKVAVFKYDYSVYKVDIVNNVCDIPSEVLETTGVIKMGVYAYATNGEELVIRYSPAMEELTVTNGSYSKEGKTPEIITPSQYELYGEALMVGLTELSTGLEKLDNEVDKLITDKENGVFNGKDGVNGKDGYTPVKGVDYRDGVDGTNGKDGYTPVKNKDYFDGKDGVNGTNGKDGVTPTLKVGSTTTGNAGTNAKVTMSQSGTTYTLDFTIPKGADGKDGENGSGGDVDLSNYYTKTEIDNKNYITNDITSDFNIDGKLYLNTVSSSVNANTSSRIVFGNSGKVYSYLASNDGGAFAFSCGNGNITLYPKTNNYNCIMSDCDSDLGRTDRPWVNLYLKGSISNGTVTIPVSKLANKDNYYTKADIDAMLVNGDEVSY